MRFLFLIRVFVISLISIIDSIRVVFVTKINKKPDVAFRIINSWAKRVLKVAGIRLKVTGKERLVSSNAYIYAANHASLFDIPLLFAALDSRVSIIYKKELEKIPVFGWGLKHSPLISIERSDARNSMGSIDTAVNSIKTNVSVIIFPEGTRSKTGELQEFKRGAFMLASRAGKPIVPVSVIGSSKIMPSGKLYFESHDVEVVIHQPIENSEPLSRQQEKELMEKTYNIIGGSLSTKSN